MKTYIRDYQIILRRKNYKDFVVIITPFTYHQNMYVYGNVVNYLKTLDRDIKKYFETNKQKEFNININPIYVSNSYY